MERDRKWHIYNMEHEPLCWDKKALEFDYPEDAHDFLRDVKEYMLRDTDRDMLESVVVVQDILFYDGGYINATDLRVKEDKDAGVIELVKMEIR